MEINRLELSGIRVFEEVAIGFSSGINVITGRNAQGKTTILEGIYYPASGRSFRTSSEKELIRQDRESGRIRAEIRSSGREQTIEVKLTRGKRREVVINGVKQKKIGEAAGRLAVVMFNPDDLDMIREGAAVRRRVMDLCISQLRPKYQAALTEYNKLYDHKTRILRDYHEKPSLLELLDDYDYRLAQHSAQLIYYRTSFTRLLAKKAEEIHKDFSGGREELEIRYKTVTGVEPDGKKPADMMAALMEHQRRHRSAELRSGTCLSGAHKDDLEISIDGLAARKFASQGQARTAAISIKLAERDIHFEDSGEYPVLLLDDVLSELDGSRQSFLLGRIPAGQVIITCCDDSYTKDIGNARVFRVESGRIV